MKLKYLTLLFLTLFIFSCKKNTEGLKSISTQVESNTNENMEQNKLIKFGINYAKAWSSQIPEKVAEYFAVDASLTVNNGEPSIGSEAIINVAKGFMDAFPDMVVTMDSLVTKLDKKQFHWTLIGTNTGPNGTGNKVNISGFEEWTLNKNGLVQKSNGCFDEEDYNRQLIGSE